MDSFAYFSSPSASLTNQEKRKLVEEGKRKAERKRFLRTYAMLGSASLGASLLTERPKAKHLIQAPIYAGLALSAKDYSLYNKDGSLRTPEEIRYLEKGKEIGNKDSVLKVGGKLAALAGANMYLVDALQDFIEKKLYQSFPESSPHLRLRRYKTPIERFVPAGLVLGGLAANQLGIHRTNKELKEFYKKEGINK